MIATILPSSTTFHAVDYNERKVSEGVAELLEMKNFGSIGKIDPYTPDELKQYLIDYTQRNEYIKKPQFHLAISCRGDEYTQEQLLDIAHQYLKEMGYSEEGQPVLIYSHHDTDNNHLHIVTSRIAPDGHKIDHNQERIRSQEVISRIIGENQEQRASRFPRLQGQALRLHHHRPPNQDRFQRRQRVEAHRTPEIIKSIYAYCI